MEAGARFEALAQVAGAPDPASLAVKPDRLSLTSIDVLRAVAALAVLAYHLAIFVDPIVGIGARSTPVGMARRVIDHGWLGVSLFFVISGFCIHLPYALRQRVDVGEYIVRRFARIWPPFAVAVLIGVGLRLGAGDSIRSLVRPTLAALSFIFDSRNPIFFDNVVFWSVVIEVQLYVLYLAIRLLTPRGRPFALAAWTIGFVIFGFAWHMVLPGEHVHSAFLTKLLNPRFFAPARMGEWLLGAWAADRLVRAAAAGTRSPIDRAIGIAYAIGGAAVVIINRIVSPLVHEAGVRHEGKYRLETVDAIGFALLVWGLASLERRTEVLKHSPVVWRTLPTRFLAAIGNRSYSIYLLHFIMLQLALDWAVQRFLPAGQTRVDLIHSVAGIGIVVGALAFVFVIAEVNYRMIELPSHRLARHLGKALGRRDRGPLAAPSVATSVA